MVNVPKLERLFNRLFLAPINQVPRQEYAGAWQIPDSDRLCALLEDMTWITTELQGTPASAVACFAELHYGERRYWPVPALRHSPELRLMFLAEHTSLDGKKKCPCLIFPSDPLDAVVEVVVDALSPGRETVLREVVFGHTRAFFREQPLVRTIASGRNGGAVEEVVAIVRNEYVNYMHNCVRVAFHDERMERDVTFAEFDEGTMVCGYIPFRVLSDRLRDDGGVL